MSYQSLNHSKWDCKYHLVFIPHCRKKVLYGKIREFLGRKFHELAKQRESEILEGHMVQDHCHMLIKIPPKYSISEVVGYLKGKSAIAVARQFSGRKPETYGLEVRYAIDFSKANKELAWTPLMNFEIKVWPLHFH